MNLTHAVQSGKISEAVIDTAVCRVLRMKFEMGLFEHPYVNPKSATKVVRSEEHIRLAHKVAQSSIVLLKNKNSILPLNKRLKKWQLSDLMRIIVIICWGTIQLRKKMKT